MVSVTPKPPQRSERIVIPRTRLMQTYKKLREMTQGPRLDEAKKYLADGGVSLASEFADSVAKFAPYDNSEDRFYPYPRKSYEFDPNELSDTYAVSLRLEAQKRLQPKDGHDRIADTHILNLKAVPASALGCDYVDKELLAQRTTSPAEWDAEPKRNVGGVRLDVLLADADPDDRTPIVGEVKVGLDMDPFFALVQGLACAAHMVTPNQYRRLRSHLPPELDFDLPEREQPRMDVWLLLVDPPPPKGTRQRKYLGELTAAADVLAPMTLARDEVRQYIRRIAGIRVALDPADTSKTKLTGEVKWAWETAA